MLATYVVLYSFISLTILDFLHSVEIAFFLFSHFFSLFLFMCAFVLQFSCWHVIWFYLMLMSTGCLAPLTPWLFQAASTLISTSNIFIIVIYFWARVSKNKDWLIACLKPRNSVELKKSWVQYSETKTFSDHYMFLGNCPPTLFLSQHFAQSEK